MNKFINWKLKTENLLTGNMSMTELHLTQPGFTYSACGPFTKHHERLKNLEKQVI